MTPGWHGLGRAAAVLGLLLPLLAGCLPASSEGERLYGRHCASCHGDRGSGGIRYLADEGANLLDDTWKYGGDPSEIEYSILNDELRGHTTWDFTHQQREQIVGHILALRGERP